MDDHGDDILDACCCSCSAASSASSVLSPGIFLPDKLELLEPTHRGLHRFVPRHPDEIEVDIGDPVYVQREAEDLWCEGEREFDRVPGESRDCNGRDEEKVQGFGFGPLNFV